MFYHEKLQDVLVGRGKSCSCFKIEIFPPCFCFLSSDNRTSLCPFVLPLSPSPPLPKKAACGFFHGFFYNLEKYFPFHKFSTPAVNNRTSPLVSLTPAVNRTSFCPSVLPPCPFFLRLRLFPQLLLGFKKYSPFHNFPTPYFLLSFCPPPLSQSRLRLFPQLLLGFKEIFPLS